MDFSTILKDEATFPDTAEITLGTEKVTLGQIRELSRSQQKQVADQVNALQRERDEAKSIATKAAELMEKVNTAPPATQTVPDDFDTDAWWEPVRKKFNPLADQLKAIEAGQKAIQESVARAASIWAQDRWKGQYERGKERLKGPKYSEWTFEKVRDFAATNKHLDEYGFPAIDKAISEITKEDEISRIRQEEYERGVREGAVKSRLASTARPTSSAGIPKPEGVGLKSDGNFQDLGDAVMSDRDLAEAFSQLSGLSPDDLLQ